MQKRQPMKINSPQAEISRAEQRTISRAVAERANQAYGPYYLLSGPELVAVNMARRLQEAIKREEQYVRIIKGMGKPKKAPKCRPCAGRKLRLSKKTPESPAKWKRLPYRVSRSTAFYKRISGLF